MRILKIFLILSALTLCASADVSGKEEQKSLVKDFASEKSDLSSKGKNPYFILEPGYQLTLVGGDTKLVITVLDETLKVDGIETRIVEEREWEDEKLVEVSRNYFAISKSTNDVFYFGEDCDIYNKKGKIISHEGGWRAGVDGAKAGLIMPGNPKIGTRYYEEYAPDVAMDRGEIISMSEVIEVPAGKFENVLKIEETSALNASEKEYKYYAKGVGLLIDEDLKLVKYGFEEK
jgi:hypothetical protein